jgi:small subunit ribosomal protein S7
MVIKIFDLFETTDIKIEDPGLKRYINLTPKLMLKTRGREKGSFATGKINLVERLINHLGVPGHRGKKHTIITGWASGKYSKNVKTVINAMKMIQERTNQNPVQVLVQAIENAAPKDEITTIEYGGARYPQAVDCSPVRRLNLAIRHLVHGSYNKAFGKKKTMTEALADEIISASQNSGDSFAVTKRNETEKQADSAR